MISALSPKIKVIKGKLVLQYHQAIYSMQAIVSLPSPSHCEKYLSGRLQTALPWSKAYVTCQYNQLIITQTIYN